MQTTEPRMEAKFTGKGKVFVSRCGGRGLEMIGKEVHATAAAGTWKTVRLISVIADYGPGDGCEFAIAWN